MPLPEHVQSIGSLYKRCEQVVPVKGAEGNQFMEASLPNEKGAAVVMQAKITETQVVETIDEMTDSGNQQMKMNRGLQHPLRQEREINPHPFNLEEESNQLLLEHYSLQHEDNATQHSPGHFPFGSDSNPQWLGQYPIHCEADIDMGYSSHSACSSCQHGSQVDSAGTNTKYDDGYTECFNADEEMEDLLFHFDRFFRNRYEEILTEQEMHVRQIVKKVIKTCNDKDGFTEAVEITDKATQTEKFSFPSIILKEDCQVSTETKESISSKKLTDDCIASFMQKDRLLLKLTSLTCAISNLLQRKEYKT